ncbi:MAG: ribulose-phosphate 3-epimerase [Flavobacteriaceae bacterium]
MSIEIAPSLLAANFGALNQEIETLNASKASLLHLDVMDGSFVPNISFGPVVIEAVAKNCKLDLDIHLMIEDPDRYIADYASFKPKYISVHEEACRHLDRSIDYIKSFGIGAGVAINPHTPVANLFTVLHKIDLVCIMSVNPGFGGQKFIPYTLKKIEALRAEVEAQGLHTKIEVDGGVTEGNAAAVKAAGADILVAGSSVFKAENPLKAIENLHGA